MAYKGYDERRSEIRRSREQYGSQWVSHLDRYGPVAYFYELAGILGRLEAMVIDGDWRNREEEIQDKLLDLGNYASFIHDWIEYRRALTEHEEVVEELSP